MEIKVGESYIDLPCNQRSTIKPQKHIVDYCAFCSIPTKLFPLTTNVSVHRIYEFFLVKRKLSDIGFTNGLQTQDITILENLNVFYIKVIQIDYPKQIKMKHLSIHYGPQKKSPIDLLFYKNQFCKKK